MELLSRLKTLFGLSSGTAEVGSGTTITVEREPTAESERAVKEPVEEASPAAESTEPAADAPGPDDGSEPDDTGEPVQSISGIGPAYAERLADAGVETVGELADADPAALHAETELGVGRLAEWIERAKRS